MSPRGSDFNASMSNLGKPSPRSRRSTKHGKGQEKQYDEASKINEEVKIKDEEEDDHLPIDGLTGMQMYENELKLTAMQKLQLRIAQHRNINVDTLKGEEYQVLKEYKKLEERKEQINTFDDFF